MTVVDLWVNPLTGRAAAAFMGQPGNEGIPVLPGGDLSAASTLQQLPLLFASDHPFLSTERAMAAARDLPLPDAAAQANLGGTAARLLHLD